MDATWYDTWLNSSSLLVVGGVLPVSMIVAAIGGIALRAGLDWLAEPGPSETQEGYIVWLGLLARCCMTTTDAPFATPGPSPPQPVTSAFAAWSAPTRALPRRMETHDRQRPHPVP